MKRTFLCLFILIVFSSFLSAQFKELYHQNYDYVERIVLVFQDKPQYMIKEETSNLNIIIHESINGTLPTNEVIKGNKVIKGIDYKRDNGDLIVEININKEDNSPYQIKSFTLSGDAEKLVIDVFRYKHPTDPTVYDSYATFYGDVGFPEKKKIFVDKADSLRFINSNNTEPSKQEEATAEIVEVANIEKSQKTDQKEEPAPKKSPTTANKQLTEKRSFLESLKNMKPGYWIIILVVAMLLVLSLMIYSNPSKHKIKDKPKPTYRKKEGFGNEEYRINMIKNMKNSGWGNDEIAKELMISLDEVKALSKKIEQEQD